MTRMTSSRLGRYGEKLVCDLLDFRRQPGSGSTWPWKEDLVREIREHREYASGLYSDELVLREMAQVKTTTNPSRVRQWGALSDHAIGDLARPRWFEVVVTPGGDWVFEMTLIATARKGTDSIGGGSGDREDRGPGDVRRRRGRGVGVRGKPQQRRDARSASVRRREGVV